jgi:glucokinase
MTTLVADIGATNARFQLAQGEVLVDAPLILRTAEFDRAESLLERALDALGRVDITGAVLAVAGPIEEAAARVELTNTGLLFERWTLAAALDCDVLLINDFFALAHAVPDCTELVQIGGGQSAPGPKALLGPGTGFGMATLVPLDSGWHVLPSEGGHADLAPGSFLESEIWGLLTQAHGHVSWETVLSGSGLVNLYRAVSSLWGGAPDDLSAADITNRGASMDDPVCHQTLETFCALLGAAAGNLALTVTATGGVYIGGGIAPRMIDFIQSSPLRRRFEERGDLSEFARNIPLWVMVEAEPGLRGALSFSVKQKVGVHDG